MNVYPQFTDQKIKTIYDWIQKVILFRVQDIAAFNQNTQEIETIQSDITSLTASVGAVLPAVGNAGNVLTDSGAAWISQAPVTQKPAFNAIGGLIISGITGTHTTAAFSISKGGATDSAGAAYISVAATLNWLASNGNAINGTDAAASTLANSSTYHVFICTGASGTGSFVSASLTPTFPTGYAVSSRRIGSFNTTGAGAPIAYTSIESEGGSTINYLATQVLDISTSTQGTALISYTLSVPTGIKVRPLIRVDGSNATGSSGCGVLFLSGDETSVATPAASEPGWTAAPGWDMNNGNVPIQSSHPFVTTNSSGQIGACAAAASTSLFGVTRGWIDMRRS